MVVSVVIRARDAESDLRACLPAVARQRLPEGTSLRTVVVDNESSDATKQAGESFGAMVVPITNAEFSWGRALNRGIRAVNADVAVLLSADATPADHAWLAAMVEPFSDARIAAVYGRQEPRANAPVDEAVRLRRAFDAAARALTATRVEEDLVSGRWVCSNACAAVRVAAWKTHPFDETVPASEELPWIRTVLAAGWSAVYEPKARVFHSHREGILRSAVRLWEFRENAKRSVGGRASSVPRLVGALIKGRVANCLQPGLRMRSVLEGLLRLPAECAAIVLVAACARRPEFYGRLRQLAWSTRAKRRQDSAQS